MLTEAPAGEPASLALVAAVNDFRATQGLGPLRHDPSLDLAGRTFALQLCGGHPWAHDPADEIAARVKTSGYAGGWSGECLAQGTPQSTPAQVVKMWIDDLPHRRILLGAHAAMGGGCATKGAVTYWCADFGVTS